MIVIGPTGLSMEATCQGEFSGRLRFTGFPSSVAGNPVSA
jgi:hypothetical protein